MPPVFPPINPLNSHSNYGPQWSFIRRRSRPQLTQTFCSTSKHCAFLSGIPLGADTHLGRIPRRLDNAAAEHPNKIEMSWAGDERTPTQLVTLR